MHVKEMPRRINGNPVVKGVFLGWVRDLPFEAGYACFVLTHDHSADGLTFRAHLMRANGLDKPWKTVEELTSLTRGAADALFAQNEKTAVWPEGKE